MPLVEEISPLQRNQILRTARQGIEFGLENGRAMVPEVDGFDPALKESGACFVTLHLEGQLRGCCGSLAAYQSLIVDVAHNAFNSAFRDFRFPPVTGPEIDRIHIGVSILTPPEPWPVKDEIELLENVCPGVDGLFIESGMHRATFLPDVWEQLPDPQEFLIHLKHKAGLGADAWPEDMRVSRYRTLKVAE